MCKDSLIWLKKGKRVWKFRDFFTYGKINENCKANIDQDSSKDWEDLNALDPFNFEN